MSDQITIDFYQVDAFTQHAFGGNPAAVCPLEKWLSDNDLQKIAEENNLSETAFLVAENDGYRLRWFTPAVEVDLCGHATLASAWVLFNLLGYAKNQIKFFTRSGELTVTQSGEELCMDFPAKKTVSIDAPANLLTALGISSANVISVHKSDDILVEVNHEQIIENLAPDFNLLNSVDTRGVIVTSRSAEFDFISRWFGPRVGVNEDPVTGSAHTTLAPYWQNKIGNKRFKAQQGGQRKGYLDCQVSEDGSRVLLFSHACLVISGQFYLSKT